MTGYQLLATGANLIDKKNDRPLPHQIRRQPKTERENPNHMTKRMKVLLIKEATLHVNGEIAPIRRVVTGILTCVRATFQKQDADMAKIALSDMLSWRRSQQEVEERRREKDQLLC